MRATVRNPDDEARLAVLKALPGAAERLTFWQADLLVPGAFDKAIDGAYACQSNRLKWVVDASRSCWYRAENSIESNRKATMQLTNY